MRHRVTFVHSRGKENGIKSLNSTHVEVIPGSSREDRFTFDAPRYSHIRSIRIQVIKPFQHTLQTSPFAYDYQIGLHIYIVPEPIPEVGERHNFYTQVHDVIHDLFGIGLTENDWILSLNSLYFHTHEFLEPRGSLAAQLPSSWDAIDYSVSDGKVKIKSLQAVLNLLEVDAGERKEYKEVGTFHIEELTTRDDLVLSGARVVFNDEDVGEFDKEEGFVHRTLFHIKPRHRQTDHISVVYKPNGLHPIMSVEKPPKLPEDDDLRMCKLYYYLTLDKSVFLDRYQMPDLLKILVSYGSRDLELPEYSVEGWGNEILLEVKDNAQYPLDLTLHSRYQLPNNKADHTEVIIDKPFLFYGCEVGSDAFLLKNSPFDNKVTIGGSHEKFFTDDTVFYQVLEPGTVNIAIPNAHGDANWVNFVTLLAVLLGVLLIVPKVFKRKMVNTAKKNE